MATVNRNAILNAIYGQGTVQVLEGTENKPEKLIVNGKIITLTYAGDDKISHIKVGVHVYPMGAVSSRADACMKVETFLNSYVLPEHVVSFTKGDTYYKNGRRENIYETIKDINPSRLFEILNEYLTTGEDWQREYALGVLNWVKNNLEFYLFSSRHHLETDMTEEEIKEREEYLAGV